MGFFSFQIWYWHFLSVYSRTNSIWKKNSWLILAWSCWRMFSQKGPRIRTRLTPTSSSFGSCQHILTTVPKTTFSSGPGHGSRVPRQVLERCGNNCAYTGKWASVYPFHLLCDTVDAEVGKPVRWSLLASPKNRSSNGVCSPAVLRNAELLGTWPNVA